MKVSFAAARFDHRSSMQRAFVFSLFFVLFLGNLSLSLSLFVRVTHAKTAA
jgi:hypothetical protein